MKPLVLLERLAEAQHPMGLAELAAELAVPKPTVHRWLGVLDEAGLVQRTLDGRRYEVAQRATRLAFSILSNKPSGAIRHEILRQVVRDIGEACNLTILDGTEVRYLDRVESQWPLRITFQPGSRVPAYCSASGKLFLALMQPAKRDLALSGMKLEKKTDSTIVGKSALAKEFTDIRSNGYALDREEYLPGLVCLAVPVFQKKGRSRSCAAALAIQAPVARLSLDDMLTKLPVLQGAADAMSETIRHDSEAN
jgi:DNA-binding IclR family transcriptional regulator